MIYFFGRKKKKHEKEFLPAPDEDDVLNDNAVVKKKQFWALIRCWFRAANKLGRTSGSDTEKMTQKTRRSLVE